MTKENIVQWNYVKLKILLNKYNPLLPDQDYALKGYCIFRKDAQPVVRTVILHSDLKLQSK